MNYESGKPICVRIREREEFTIQLGRYSIIEVDELKLYDFFLDSKYQFKNYIPKYKLYPIYFNDIGALDSINSIIHKLREHYKEDVNIFFVLYVREDIPIVKLIKLLNCINDLCGIRYTICLRENN